MSKSISFSPLPQCQISPVLSRSDTAIYIQPIPSSAGACQRWGGWKPLSCLATPTEQCTAAPERESRCPQHVCFAACYLCQKGGGTSASLSSHIWLRCGNRLSAQGTSRGLWGEDSAAAFEARVASKRHIPLCLMLFSPTRHVAAYRVRSGPLGSTHACMCWMHTHRCVFVCGLLRIKNASFCLRQCFQCLPFQLGGLCF